MRNHKYAYETHIRPFYGVLPEKLMNHTPTDKDELEKTLDELEETE